ncbi:MAG: cytochrome c5 [Planctomycetota bacterium]|jgi:cytochrome c5
MLTHTKKTQISLVSMLLIAMLFLMPSCASTPTMNASTDGQVANPHLEGKILYRKKCGECHGLYAPSMYTDASWLQSMQDMAPQAFLTKEHEKLITDFLLASN